MKKGQLFKQAPGVSYFETILPELERINKVMSVWFTPEQIDLQSSNYFSIPS